MPRRYVTALAVLLGAIACGDDGGSTQPLGIFDPGDLPDVILPSPEAGAAVPDAGGPSPVDAGTDASTAMDATAGDAAAEVDAGTVDAGSDAATVAEDDDVYIVGDVRTNIPHLVFRDLGSANLKLVSIFLRRVSTPSFESVLIHGEYENRGTAQQCIPLLDLTLGGLDIIAVAEVDEHVDDLGNTIGCISPGQRSVFMGIENDIPPTLIDDSDLLFYDFTALERSHQLHPATPTLISAERYEREGEWGFTGRMLTTAMPIYNMSIDFFAKDSRGLVVDDTSAFPLDLDTIPTNTVVEYTSYRFAYLEGPPDGYIAVMSFIEGARPAQTASVSPPGAPLSPAAARLQEARARRALHRELRSMLP